VGSAAHAEWLRAVRRSLVIELSRFRDGWIDDGELVVGPGTVAVRAAITHDSEPGHVDLGFVLNRDRPDAPVIWDCVAGGPAQDDVAAQRACSIWAQTTAPVIMELLTQKSQYADHAHGDDGLGLAGWHSIHGAILGYGTNDATALQRWCLDNAVVPALRDVLAPALSPAWLHGAKFLLGAFDEDSIAEVRIDGIRHEACSDTLLKLPWPKEGKRVARFFVLFVHAEGHPPE
jgi:hypothetical protein